MKKLYSLLAILATAAMALGFASCGGDDDDDSGVMAPPEAFEDALVKLYPQARGVKWEKNGPYIVAEFQQDMADYDVWFEQSASWAMTEIDYGKNLSAVPDKAVTDAFKSGDYSSWMVDDVSCYKQKTREFYVIEVEAPQQIETDLYYATDGTLIKAVPDDQNTDIYPDTKI